MLIFLAGTGRILVAAVVGSFCDAGADFNQAKTNGGECPFFLVASQGEQSEKVEEVVSQGVELEEGVVGGGELQEEFERAAERRGLTGKVVFAGWWEEVEKVYADTDVTVLMSDNEGTPVCLIESLSAGVPVVSTDVGGMADVMRNGETGFLVPPGDASALASGIAKLIDDPGLREKMGWAGMDDMCNRYSHDRLVNDIVSLYRELD